MRKILTLALGVLFVVGLTATAFAVQAEIPADTKAAVAKGEAQVTLGGEIKIWNWVRDHVTTGGVPTISNSTAFSWQRVRLGLNVKSGNSEGMIELESLSGPEGGSSDFFEWGSGNAKQSSVNIRQAWLQYKGDKAGIKAGHMGLKLGEGKFFNWTRYGTDAIVVFADPSDKVHVSALTFKVAEGVPINRTDDVDGYVALVVAKPSKDISAGLNYTLLRGKNNAAAGFTDMQLHNVGLHAGGSAGDLSFAFEADVQTGHMATDLTTVLNLNRKPKARGYGLFASLAFKADPMKIRLSGAYGSGDDDATDGNNRAFQTYLGPDMNIAWMYEYQIRSASGGGNTSGITNTFYGNAGLDFSATKDLGVSLDGYYFRAVDTAPTVSKDVGVEVDLKTVYKLTKNLSWTVMAGYFKTGDFYPSTYMSAKEDALAARSDLTLSF